MERTLSIGYSPCPNDTYIFHALTHGKLQSGGIEFKETLQDVETLNRMTMRGALDVSKISYHALGFVRDDYCLLRSGGALGRGCGPLIVARKPMKPEELRGKLIAIPGMLTTAYLLMQLFDPSLKDITAMPFDLIMKSVESGNADAGLIIHEGRFTYQNYGLHMVADLGRWWEGATGLPIPLGCIVARRSLGAEVINQVEELIRASVLYASKCPDDSTEYIKAHAQEIEDKVVCEHIALYVNEFTLDLGEEGERAVRELMRRGEEKGIIERSRKPLFAE